MRKGSQAIILPPSPPVSNPSSSHTNYQQPLTGSTPSASFGPLPSWFPQSHLQNSSYDAASSQTTYPFADPRSQIRPESYPLLASTSQFQPRSNDDVYFAPATSSKRGIKGERKSSASTIAQKGNGRLAKNEKDTTASPVSEDEEDVEDRKEPKKAAKKRRRVVVACDTCRRKKVKCEGLPNGSNTCDNCQNFGYVCTFKVEPDRSRGRYEILEAQRDAVLAALRQVAPELADQFDRGELSTSNLGGMKTEHQQLRGAEELDLTKTERTGEASTSGQALDLMEGAPRSSEHDSITLSREPKRDLGPMIPDLEDGRPRYFGGSSNLTNFHHLDSRPPSPGPRQRTIPSRSSETGRHGSAADMLISGNAKPSTGEASSINRLAVLPRPRPLYPSNSIGWVRQVRKKTLVAIGRDEVYGAEGWFQRFAFPKLGLLNELLDLFFQQLNPLLPIIHEQSLRRDLAHGRAEKDSAFRGLVFTIIAIASRFMHQDPRVLADEDDPDSAGDHWAAASRFHHQVYAASLINVQVLLITTTFMPSTLGVGTSWTVLGAAIRALQDIGLHTERAYSEYNPFEQEMRRRAFWAAVILDGILSINMGRPSALRLADTSVKFPVLASEEALMKAETSGGPIEEQSPFDLLPCPAAGFIHLIKLNIIVQDVVNTLYSPRWKQEFGPQHQAGHPPTPQKSPASYKDMMILCKRLDEWVDQMPGHLQSIESSPYKLQAGLLQCGRHDIRLYILKPFLQDAKPAFPNDQRGGGVGMQEGSILRKMLLPQCASHARECLRILAILSEEGQLTHMVFVMQQAFLSAATFMLTVWHETRDVRMLGQDRDLIEATLSMLRPEENRYCSALLRRAQRILCNIAQRSLRAIPDENQKMRMQRMIESHGTGHITDGPKLFGGAAASSQGQSGALPHRQSVKDEQDMMFSKEQTGNVIPDSTRHRGIASSSSDVNLHESRRYSRGSSGMSPASGQVSDPFPSFDGNVSTTPSKDKNGAEVSAFGQWLPYDDSLGSALRDDLGEASHFSDLNWTEYFSKFLGGLPNPSSSPFLSNMESMSPLVNYTP